MESQLSSLLDEFKPEDYIQPHYRESYRLAIDALVSAGREAYTEVLKSDRLGDFLSEDELLFIEETTERPAGGGQPEEPEASPESSPSTGTYWPVHSDLDAPDLDLGWPEVTYGKMNTNINLFFHPPRQNSPTIKEVIRKHIQDARQVIAIAMDVFTDIDIFKEVVDASVRGVPVYVVLDDYQFKTFLTMAEKQNVHQFRNIRVRTVKGQEYLCRSGAKFHGVMGEKFLLVDCHTVVYGSYSFMWSYEKINLSMVQVITGQLVESYDEEFRMLYARSVVPEAFMPAEAIRLQVTHEGSRAVPGYSSKLRQPFERKDHLRHTMDAVYMRTCGNQAWLQNPVESFEHELLERGPYNQHIANGHMVPQRIHQLQSTDLNSFLKRHSYAGERNENSCVPNHLIYGTSNWNVARDSSQLGVLAERNDLLSRGMENPLQPSRMIPTYNRGSNVRQSFHGNDKQILSMQQNMPSLDRTAKTFLRNWRIQSYLSHEDQPIGDSSDYLDHCEVIDNKANPYLHSRLRSSLVFKSTIPEQPESSSYTSNSQASAFQTNQLPPPANSGFHPSIQRIPAYGVGNRVTPNDYLLKRRSLQVLDDTRNNLYNGYNQSSYASLGRNKGSMLVKNPEGFHEERYKRFSLAESRSSTSYITNKEFSGHGKYGSGQAIAGGPNETTRTDRHPPSNLKEDQRSVSHYDFKQVADQKDPSVTIWQDPPSRTVSATALTMSSQEPPAKTSSSGSPQFFKKSSKKIISLLNIPEKKEGSHKVASSSDSKTPEEARKSGKKKGALSNTTNTDKSTDGGRTYKGNGGLLVKENHFMDDVGTSSAPRFSTEELQQDSPFCSAATEQRVSPTTCVGSSRPTMAAEIQQSEQKRERRSYSRFEPFCSFEKRQSEKSMVTSAHLQGLERFKSLPGHATRGKFIMEQSSSSRNQVLGHHDNKFGRFMQRVGNLIHKNK